MFVSISKNVNFNRLMTRARDIIRFKLPIKCLEATVLAIYLTLNLPINRMERFYYCRFAMSFLSVCEGQEHRHIVLVVSDGSLFGALGLSRKSSLMYKSMKFKVPFPILLLLVSTNVRVCMIWWWNIERVMKNWDTS